MRTTLTVAPLARRAEPITSIGAPRRVPRRPLLRLISHSVAASSAKTTMTRSSRAITLIGAPSPLDDASDPHAELAVDHDDLAMRDERPVDQHVDRRLGRAVQ